MGRAWFSRGRWWYPLVSADEYGRRTVVLPLLPGLLALILALWTCDCDDCELSRFQTEAGARYRQMIGDDLPLEERRWLMQRNAARAPLTRQPE